MNKNMQIQNEPIELNKKIVNDSIKICVNCGNTTVLIQNSQIFCKKCDHIFEVKKRSG